LDTFPKKHGSAPESHSGMGLLKAKQMFRNRTVRYRSLWHCSKVLCYDSVFILRKKSRRTMALRLNSIRYIQWTCIGLAATKVPVKVPCATDSVYTHTRCRCNSS